MTDTIIKLQSSDLISDSMLKINHNFEIISNRDDVTESKLNEWTKNIENRLADIQNENGIISNTLLNNVHKLENKIDNLTDLDGITKEVQNAINNATIDVENLINDKAGEVISSKLGDYVKTSSLNGILDGYVTSTAFDTYRSDSSKSFAQSSRIVANSKFLKLPNGDVDCLVRISGEITGFESVEDYFKSLSASEKKEILGNKSFSSDDKALEDPDVIVKLIGVCEKTFKTVVTEMSIISQEVGDGFAESSIITAVKGENGKEIAASIFTQANEGGSGITLNADKILINSGKTLNVQSGGNINIQSGGKFQVKSGNFNIDESGNVRVTGAIEATRLTIKNGTGTKDISDYNIWKSELKGQQGEKGDKGDKGDTGPQGPTGQDGKDAQLTDEQKTALNSAITLTNAIASGSTQITGGLTLTNILEVKDENENVVGGLCGLNTNPAGFEGAKDVGFWLGGTLQNALSNTNPASIVFKKDGSGHLAGGNITWDNAGNTTYKGNVEIGGTGSNAKILLNTDGSGKLANGNISWTSSGTTTYKGKVEIGGTGTSAKIALNTDGSGKLANGSITWNNNGGVTISGNITANKFVLNKSASQTTGETDTAWFSFEAVSSYGACPVLHWKNDSGVEYKLNLANIVTQVGNTAGASSIILYTENNNEFISRTYYYKNEGAYKGKYYINSELTVLCTNTLYEKTKLCNSSNNTYKYAFIQDTYYTSNNTPSGNGYAISSGIYYFKRIWSGSSTVTDSKAYGFGYDNTKMYISTSTTRPNDSTTIYKYGQGPNLIGESTSTAGNFGTIRGGIIAGNITMFTPNATNNNSTIDDVSSICLITTSTNYMC